MSNVAPMGVDLNSLLYAVEQVMAAIERGEQPQACSEWPLLERGIKEWHEYQAKNTIIFGTLPDTPARR